VSPQLSNEETGSEGERLSFSDPSNIFARSAQQKSEESRSPRQARYLKKSGSIPGKNRPRLLKASKFDRMNHEEYDSESLTVVKLVREELEKKR
jgi:hypothetical protein